VFLRSLAGSAGEQSSFARASIVSPSRPELTELDENSICTDDRERHFQALTYVFIVNPVMAEVALPDHEIHERDPRVPAHMRDREFIL
jgi:hypothetical protein